MATYVCSDIHGRYDRFLELLDTIEFNENDELFILGDAIDRGPDSISIIKYIMNNENIHLLMGNHEVMMFDFFNSNDTLWLYPNNGGRKTFLEFEQESEESQKEILNFVNNLPYIQIITVDDKKFHLSHSGTIDRVEEKEIWFSDDLSEDEKFDIAWLTPYRSDLYLSKDKYNKDYIYLIGHVPVQKTHRENMKDYKIIRDNNLIDLDGGCALSSQELEYPEVIRTALSCLRLENMEEFYICDTEIL